MKNVALLTMDSLQGFESYDLLLINPLKEFGWKAEQVSWKTECDWSQYDAVIVRSTWDYQDSSVEFLNTLEKINSQTHLENSIDILKWNMNKIYLKQLEEKNIFIVPSIWPEKFSENELTNYFDHFNVDEIIIKPLVSANADNTFWLTKSNYNSQLAILNSQFQNRKFFVQPFMKNIIREGEYSLFYFGGEYSHAILKTPKRDDFRVQEEHGGILKLVQPEESMKREAEKILKVLGTDLLYARIDFVRTDDNKFALMELELIEPSLYFNMDPDSPQRFAKIFDSWMNKISQS